jgi:hypothetical protein
MRNAATEREHGGGNELLASFFRLTSILNNSIHSTNRNVLMFDVAYPSQMEGRIETMATKKAAKKGGKKAAKKKSK